MNNSHFISYIKLSLGLIALIFIIAISFNLFMNPLDLFEVPRFKGINSNKVFVFQHQRTSKAAAVHKIKPTGIILGSSRGERGLSALHPGWKANTTYNLSISGSNIYEILRYFQHANYIQPLQQVVLGINLRQFKYQTETSSNISEDILSVSANGSPQFGSMLYNYTKALISKDALKISYKTLKNQNETPRYLTHGQYNPQYILENIKEHNKEFLKNEKSYFNLHYKDYSFKNPDNTHSTLLYFRQLLDHAYKDSVDLKIVIYPSHARQWETLAACNLWDTWEEWKRKLVNINETAAQNSGQTPFPLWDFSGYNTYTTESVPETGDNKTRMHWYWESSHFKLELGDLLLDRIFNYNDSDRKIEPDFGILLSSVNIDSHLQKIRQQRQVWRNAHPHVVKEMASFLNK